MKQLLTLCLIAAAVSAGAQQPVHLYEPTRTVREQKIQLQGWGSGTISEATGIAYVGTKSVRVSTRDHFQGGTLVFGEPKDIATKFEDKSNMLTVTFFLEDAGYIYGQNSIQGTNGVSAPDLIAARRGGGPVRMGMGKDAKNVSVAAIPFKPKIKDLRLIVTTTDGKRSEAYVPVATSQPASDGWRSVSIPLQGITGLDRTNKTVSSISISSDTLATLYIGDLRIVSDTTPIMGEVLDIAKGLTLARGQEATLRAEGYGGTTVLVYQWDFDDRDGVQVDKEGQAIKYKFRKPGKFNVTLTIADKYGLKKPFTTHFPVTVNP